jgi:hypothetical protein
MPIGANGRGKIKYIKTSGYKIATLVAFSGEVHDPESGPEDFTETSKVLNPEIFSTVNPVIAARCLVGSVIEALCCWLEERPNDRMSAAEVARAVVDFNSRALLR